ncbi:MAG TPA: antibiotic ABC transporter ATP-binding protein [Cryomorphaceae bacterium]|nr:antibiotic ABC transporter ATP-binding protein [Owenweeksia sp.]HBF19713.1 antibiotic ABC transporter ATP-binding protein [Cryomorphaceae bacterium]|tara:strand:- start:1933 stop:3702 length:1770 start_codon:yes stop_codon:yes gene_type:complete
MASSISGKAFDLGLLRKIMRYVAPYRWVFYTALFLTMLLSVLATARPLLIQYVIDHFVITPDPEGLLNYTLLLLGLLVVESFVQFLFTYGANHLGQNIIRDLRVQLYEHILSFKLRYFDKTPIGTLVTRAVSDIETIANIFAEGILVIYGDLFKIVVMVGAMFYFFDYRLVLISLSVVPVLYYATRIFQIKIKSSFQDVRTQVAALNAFVQEHLTGMNIVQIFNREDAEMEKFQAINEKHKQANIRSIWYFSIFLPVIEIMSAISIGLAVWFGGLQAATGGYVTLGDLTALIIFINMLFRPLRQLADRFNTLQMGMVASERVFKILETSEHIADTGHRDLESVKGDIEFKNVKFGYKEDEIILKGVSFSVNKGQTLAIVGATGAGKSTIINLLSRFYEIWEGEILVDGQNIKDITLSSLRENIAVVLQDVFLFSDSIYNNITLNKEIPLDEVQAAAAFIGVDEFIGNLPDQYDYNVRERGNMLSVGQRQLLAFLRAYVSNPSVLVLDEATSSIDTQSEALIQKAIDKLTEGRTSIIIAHRLATIKKADKILVMDKGQVVEQGNHNELLAKGGYYTRLYEMQFKAEEEAI